MSETRRGSNLNDTVMLVGWPTPTASHTRRLSFDAAVKEMQRRRAAGYGPNQDLRVLAQMTSWPTPMANDARGSAYTYGRGNSAEVYLKLPGAARLASWPTPCAQDGPNGGPSQGVDRLPGAAALTGWATPLASDGDKTDCTLPKVEERAANGKQLSTAMQARLTHWPMVGWATPAASEAGGTPEQFIARKQRVNDEGTQMGTSVTSLSMQAKLASWATPAARDYRSNSASEEWQQQQRAEETRGKPLSEQVHRLVDSGPTPSGSTAATGSSGQLNPELSRWLQGLPVEWARSKPTEMQSRRLSQRRSSERSSKQRSTSSMKLEEKEEITMASGRRAALMAKLAKARASGTGNNFRDGKYRLAIKKMGLEDGFKGTRFQATFTVVQSAKVAVVGLGGKGPQGLEKGKVFDIIPQPIGSDVDWLAMDLDKDDQPGAGNVRRLIMDLFDRKDLSDDEYIETLSEMCDITDEGEPLPQPLNLAKGMLIDMETVRVNTKKNGIEIVTCKWSHVPESSYDQHAVSTWIDSIASQMAAAQAQIAAQAQAQLPAGAQQ